MRLITILIGYMVPIVFLTNLFGKDDYSYAELVVLMTAITIAHLTGYIDGRFFAKK